MVNTRFIKGGWDIPLLQGYKRQRRSKQLVLLFQTITKQHNRRCNKAGAASVLLLYTLLFSQPHVPLETVMLTASYLQKQIISEDLELWQRQTSLRPRPGLMDASIHQSLPFSSSPTKSDPKNFFSGDKRGRQPPGGSQDQQECSPATPRNIRLSLHQS